MHEWVNTFVLNGEAFITLTKLPVKRTQAIKDACLQMNQNISKKSNLRKSKDVFTKVKRFKIKVVISMLCVIKNRFCSIFQHISIALLTQ
jgi:hypothetical protein